MHIARTVIFFFLVALLWTTPNNSAAKSPTAPIPETQPPLSPIWPSSIQLWANEIESLANDYGFDPDFIAAVVQVESNGEAQAISHTGAVGLMGVMPAGPGMEWRPTPSELTDPAINLHWGMAILAQVVQEAGGDLAAALAAYNGGWQQASNTIPRQYAAHVLDYYGRAIAARAQISPDIAESWTIAVEIKYGNIPSESLLILGGQPVSGLRTYGEHLVYDFSDPAGNATYSVRGYAVPLALRVPMAFDAIPIIPGDTLEPELLHFTNLENEKEPNNNPSILLACLPSLSRLRGRVTTRWFAPSSCPDWHR